MSFIYELFKESLNQQRALFPYLSCEKALDLIFSMLGQQKNTHNPRGLESYVKPAVRLLNIPPEQKRAYESFGFSYASKFGNFVRTPLSTQKTLPFGDVPKRRRK